MRRRLGNILAGVSLGVGVGVSVLLVRSVFGMDEFHVWWMSADNTVRAFHVGSSCGRVQVMRVHYRLAEGGRPAPTGEDFDAAGVTMPAWIASHPGIHGSAGVYPEDYPHALAAWRAYGLWPSFQQGSGTSNGWVHGYIRVSLPDWVVMLVAGVLPARVLVRVRRRHRRRKCGLCLNCGYDLRASPERCPECGTAVAAKGVA